MAGGELLRRIGQRILGGSGDGGGAERISTVVDAVSTGAVNLRTAFTGIATLTGEQRAELEKVAADLEATVVQGQAAIGLEEARSPRLFVAGWRPFIGWVLGVALAMEYVVRPVVYWVWGIGLEQLTDTLQLFGLLAGMLGMAGYRTLEKRSGVSSIH